MIALKKKRGKVVEKRSEGNSYHNIIHLPIFRINLERQLCPQLRMVHRLGGEVKVGVGAPRDIHELLC